MKSVNGKCLFLIGEEASPTEQPWSHGFCCTNEPQKDISLDVTILPVTLPLF